MSGFETDFITGRAIGKDDHAVAIIIVPKGYGYPNPKDFPAQTPIYPDTLYDAISLPLRGVLDENGYFEPDQNQLGLSIFEHLISTTWQDFRFKVLNHPEGKITIAKGTINEEEVAPGIAIMHAQTADLLSTFSGSKRDKKAEAKTAVKIVLDATKRHDEGDTRYWGVAHMQSPAGRKDVTLEGAEIDIPQASNALRDLEPSLLRDSAKDSLRDFIIYPKIDKRQLEQAFTLLADYQDLNTGMRIMNRYFTPSPFTRSDNLMEVVEFSLKSSAAAITGLSGRWMFQEENETVDVSLREVADLATEVAVAAEEELHRREKIRQARKTNTPKAL